jgi:dienelactone hydrolase
MDFTLRHRHISGIPALELFSEQTKGKRPLVIMLHGLEATKDHVLPYGYRVAQEGFYTVFFDACEHGQRKTARFHDASAMLKKCHLYDIIFQTSHDIDVIIDAFADHPMVDINRIGLMGFSMGGMVVYDYLTRGRSSGVRAAVSVIATPKFVNRIQKDMSGDPNLAKLYDQTAISNIAAHDPSHRLSELRDLPLLILNAIVDEHMPIEDVRSFYRQAKELYSCPDHIRLVEYEDIGHTITMEMMSEAGKWFRKFL